MRACLPPSRTHQTSYPLPERLGYCAPASQRGDAPYSDFPDRRQSFVDCHGSAYDRARIAGGAVADFCLTVDDRTGMISSVLKKSPSDQTKRDL